MKTDKKLKALWFFKSDVGSMKVVADLLVEKFNIRKSNERVTLGRCMVVEPDGTYWFYDDPHDIEFGLFPNFDFEFTKDMDYLCETLEEWKKNW